MTYRYTVRCRFASAAADLPDKWLRWLTEKHLADVLAAGAESAEIVQMDADEPTFEVRYRFASRSAFEAYERDHAPRLRAEGRRAFPLEWGLKFERTSGNVIGSVGQDRTQFP